MKIKYRIWYKKVLYRKENTSTFFVTTTHTYVRSRNDCHVAKANCRFLTWNQNYKSEKMLASELKSTTNRTDKQTCFINRSTNNVQSKHAEANMLRRSKAIRLALLREGWTNEMGVKKRRDRNKKVKEKKKEEKKKETRVTTRNTQSVPAIVGQIKRNNNLLDLDVACHAASQHGLYPRLYIRVCITKMQPGCFHSLQLLFYSIPATFAYTRLVYYFGCKLSQAVGIVSSCRGQDIPLKVYRLHTYVHPYTSPKLGDKERERETERENFVRTNPHTDCVFTNVPVVQISSLIFSLFLLQHFLQPPPQPPPPILFAPRCVRSQTLFFFAGARLQRCLSVTHCPSAATMRSTLPTVLVT